VAVSAALDRTAVADDLRDRLNGLRNHAGRVLGRKFDMPAPASQIIPIILGDERRAMAVAEALRGRGFDVRGIRPPTVPEGTSRLRISLTLNVTPSDVDALTDALDEALNPVPA
jgi:8-amino-7-oxononanoate synthase